MLCIIGGGKMGSALLGGLVEAGYDVTVVDHNASRREELEAEAQGDYAVVSAPIACEGVIIAVKPKDVEMAVSDATAAGAERVLSIAAGVTLAKLHEWAGAHVPVLRAMPNIGAVVQRSATALVGGSTADAADVDWAQNVLTAVGTVVRVTEAQMDAVTGLSGSGPAYTFLFAEALIDAGVSAGLPRAQAQELAFETLSGAAEMLAEGLRSPADLRADVTTPAGTTAAGVRVLEERGFRGAVIDAVLAAAKRSRELGSPAAE